MIRVVSYNVNGALDPAAVVRVLERLDPHVVCMVETPARLPLRRIARRAGLTVAATAGRRRLGVAILVAHDARVLSTHRYGLSRHQGVPDRTAVHAIVGVGGLRLSVLATQLGLRPEVREQHARELLGILGRVDAPGVLGGDLNETPGGPCLTRLTRVLDDTFAVAGEGRGETYPTPDPTARQDYVLVAPTLAVGRTFVPAEPPVDVASHHRPVVAEIAATRQELEDDELAVRDAGSAA